MCGGQAGRGGVRVSSVHPGFINTPILDPAKGTPAGQAMINVTPLGRLGQSAEALHGPLIPRAKSRMPEPAYWPLSASVRPDQDPAPGATDKPRRASQPGRSSAQREADGRAQSRLGALCYGARTIPR